MLARANIPGERHDVARVQSVTFPPRRSSPTTRFRSFKGCVVNNQNIFYRFYDLFLSWDYKLFRYCFETCSEVKMALMMMTNVRLHHIFFLLQFTPSRLWLCTYQMAAVISEKTWVIVGCRISRRQGCIIHWIIDAPQSLPSLDWGDEVIAGTGQVHKSPKYS